MSFEAEGKMKEVSECCEAELYDDNEFCVECYKKDPDTVWIKERT